MAGYYQDLFRKISASVDELEKSAAGNPAVMEQLKQMKSALEKVNFN
jgi:hypothetical protein